MPITPGTRLGPYEIVAQIGKGGMGEVYRALDTNLGRAVAIKTLPHTVADDPERLARFDTVKVLDFGFAKALESSAEGPPKGGHYGDRGVRLHPDLTATPIVTSPAVVTGVGSIESKLQHMEYALRVALSGTHDGERTMTMRRVACGSAAVILVLLVALTRAQSVYPTGTTIFDPDRAWNGYTVLSPLATQAVLVIDMNGNVVKRWEGFNNSAGGPARVLPGGFVMAASGARPPHQESLELLLRDFEGKTLWQFSRSEQIKTREGNTVWSARQHHDWQRDDFPAGYYSPEGTPAIKGGTTLILTHTNRTQPKVADVVLEDDRLIEVSANGDILWEWVASDHIDELGFADDARKVIKAAASFNKARASYDWLHVNSATYVGPNRWFDQGDKRFAPNNVIISSREASLLAIVGRDGSIVWRLGPDFSASRELRAIRQIIGQHHAHLIPKGLPGAGNLLVFDNGGSSGYGFAGPIAPDGRGAFARATSRVLEINPVTLELVWSYTNPRFFSTNISGAQRLPNGNTLVTAGAGGRMFEVTTKGEIVWEYMYPLFSGANASNAVYRAYRVPYGWIPQLTTPREQRVTPPALGDFRVP